MRAGSHGLPRSHAGSVTEPDTGRSGVPRAAGDVRDDRASAWNKASLAACTMNPSDSALPTLRALNRRFIHNFVSRDVTAHDALLHPRFHAITQRGSRMERADYLAYWATAFDPGHIVYWDMRDERIERFGTVALVSASNRWIRLRAGTTQVGLTCYTDTYVLEGGRWQCVLAQLTPADDAAMGGDEDIVVRYFRGVLDTDWPQRPR